LSHIVTEKETARSAITWGSVNPTQNRKVSKTRYGGIPHGYPVCVHFQKTQRFFKKNQDFDYIRNLQKLDAENVRECKVAIAEINGFQGFKTGA